MKADERMAAFNVERAKLEGLLISLLRDVRHGVWVYLPNKATAGPGLDARLQAAREEWHLMMGHLEGHATLTGEEARHG